MVDETSPSPANEESPGAQPTHAANTDPVIADLLNLAESINYPLRVTLTVGAFTISGHVISLAENYRVIGGLVERQLVTSGAKHRNPEQRDELRMAAASIRDHYDQQAERFALPETPEGDKEAAERYGAVQAEMHSSPREHINLRRVTIIHGSGRQMSVPFWRGRLSHVAGWFLGQAQVGEYDGLDPDEAAFGHRHDDDSTPAP